MHDSTVAINGDEVIRIVKRKIIPFAFILYFFNYMDRVNVGFAALQMNDALSISKVDFGNIASAFFISYLLFQIPANMAILRIGARRWIGSIIMCWGTVTCLMFFVHSVNQVIGARFLLGVFEAGFFPGMIYYLACWFPAKDRARVNSLFMLAIAVSSVIAAPMSGWIVEHVNTPNYEGWRWLFAIEGIPTVFLGFMTFYMLPDTPKEAKWLTDAQREWLTNTLKREAENHQVKEKPGFMMVLTNGTLWKLALAYMFVQAASQASNYWLPGQVKGFMAGLTDTEVGLLMAVPFICAMIAMPLWGAHSDKTGERKWHAALPMLLSGLAFLMIAFVPSMPFRMMGLALFGVGILSFYGPYWAIPPALLSPAGLAVSIAFINSCSSLGGFLANKGLGYVAQSYGSTGVFIVEAALCVISFLIVATLQLTQQKPKALDSAA